MSIYSQYLDSRTSDLRSTLEDAGCRPVLFVGSGASRRYIKAPSWEGLLTWLVSENPRLERPYNYYYQAASQDLPSLASLLVKAYQEYGWEQHGQGLFPDELYSRGTGPDAFLKHSICRYLDQLLQAFEREGHEHEAELAALASTSPHAIITTNYDEFLECMFPEFEVVVGQKVIRSASYTNIGDILKIHGCVSESHSLVLTRADYDHFIQRKKYLSAKLLTYFVEFPLVFIGYSATDENIRSVLSDISEMMPGGPDDLMANIWFIQWEDAISPDSSPPSEKLIDLGDGRSARVNCVVVSSFTPVFEALSMPVAVKNVNVKLLRALAASVFNIVKTKSASAEYNVNLDSLQLHSDDEQLSAILGFSDAAPADALSAGYPYTLTGVAKKLGWDYWHEANELIKKVKAEKGVDIKATNNRYHQCTEYGKVRNRIYSENAYDLLRRVRDGEPYEVDCP